MENYCNNFKDLESLYYTIITFSILHSNLVKVPILSTSLENYFMIILLASAAAALKAPSWSVTDTDGLTMAMWVPGEYQKAEEEEEEKFPLSRGFFH